MTPENVLIIGAGQAAAQLAMSLRQGGFDRPIAIIGDESYPPYQRPPLSKKFLTEDGPPDSLFLRPMTFWHDQDVAIYLGSEASQVDLQQRRVSLRDGRELEFGVLVFATGARARTLPLPGIGLPNVFSIRNIEDVSRLRAALDQVRRVAIIGGGYIGLEVAAGLRMQGRETIVVEAEARLMKRVMGETASAFFAEIHRGKGVELRLGARVVALEATAAGGLSVHMAPAEILTVDLALIAAGARANDELAATAGLSCNDGILVNAHAQTQAADVYAVGDCARFPSRRYGQRLRLECVQNAIDQAKAAAAAIQGDKQSYDPVPWFWSDQYDLKLQIAGVMDGHDLAELKGDPGLQRFSVEYRRAGRLVAVDAINDARAYMTGRRRLAEETQKSESA